MSAEVKPHRLSVEDVFRMADAGVLREEDRVELIDGVLVDMTQPSPGHSSAVAWLTRHFARGLTDKEIRVQDLLLVEGGFVMPDLMVLEPLPRDEHPSTANLVVEVSVTTQRHDARKADRYARASVAEYWIVDLVSRRVAVHRRPEARRYGEVDHLGDGDRIRALVGAPEVDISALLGPSSA